MPAACGSGVSTADPSAVTEFVVSFGEVRGDLALSLLLVVLVSCFEVSALLLSGFPPR